MAQTNMTAKSLLIVLLLGCALFMASLQHFVLTLPKPAPNATANSIDVSSSQRSDDSDVIVGSELSQAPSSGHHSPIGSYDGSTPAVRDRTLGAAMARVGMSPEEASAEIVYEEEDMGVH